MTFEKFEANSHKGYFIRVTSKYGLYISWSAQELLGEGIDRIDVYFNIDTKQIGIKKGGKYKWNYGANIAKKFVNHYNIEDQYLRVELVGDMLVTSPAKVK